MYGKAKKKPVIIDWFHWKNNYNELIKWIKSFGDNPKDVIIFNNSSKIFVKTLEGHSYKIPFGYYIIRGVKGEYYPIEEKIFNETYNLVKLVIN